MRCVGVISRFSQTKPASPESLRAHLRRVEVRQDAGDQLGRLVRIDDVARLGVERGHLDVGGEDLAVAVDEVGPAGGDRRVRVVGAPALPAVEDAEHDQPADDDQIGDGEHRHHQRDAAAHLVLAAAG